MMVRLRSRIDPQLRGDEKEEEENDDYEHEETQDELETRLGYNPQINSSNYDAQLDHDRQAKKQVLQQRFEHIFAKYGRDFEGIGDEIDLETGLIVVDNGHLKNMRNEGDAGYPEAVGFANPPADNLDPALAEDADQNMTAGSGNEAESEDDVDEDDDQESASEEAANDVFSAQEQTEDSVTTPLETEDSATELGARNSLKHGLSTHPLKASRTRSQRRKRPIGDLDPDDGEESDRGPEDISEHLESLKASMLDLQSKHKHGQFLDPNDIEELGMSIARQLADFVSGDKKSFSKPKWNSAKDPMWSYPELPRQHQQQSPQPRRRSPTPLPLFTGPSPGQKSLWAPMQHPKPRRKYKRRKGNPDPEEATQADNEPSPAPAEDKDAEEPPTQTPEARPRQCTNCECTNSLIWRSGPDGDLCNACGMYFYRYGLIRPFESLSDTEDSDADEESELYAGERVAMDGASGGNVVPNDAMNTLNFLGRHRFRGERFQMEDDAVIIKLKEIDRLSWERVAKHFPGRSAYGVQCRYSKKLHNRPVEARAYLMNQGYESRHNENGVIIFAPAPQQPRAWTDEEDDLLLKLRDEDKLEWDTIADSFPGRNARAMERRFTHLVRRLTMQRSHRQKKKPKKRKEPFTRMFTKYTTEEDDQLIKLREVDKLSWADIALRLPGRNAMALQKRYVRELAYRNQELGDDPLVQGEDGVFRPVRMKHARFTLEEDEGILHMRNDLGLGWREMEVKMPGRKWQSLENRYQYITNGFTRHLQRKNTQGTPGATNDEQSNGPIVAGAEQSDDELMQDVEDLSTIDPCSGPSIQANNQTPTGGILDKEIPDDQGQNPRGHGFFFEGEIPFTAEEDTRIRQLRELEKFSWEEIAKEVPGRSVSAISARYYQHLFPRSESVNPWSGATPLASFVGAKPLEIASRINLASSGIASKRSLRWTKEEGDMIAHYYNQGLDFEEIGERMPWRSHSAIRHFYTTKLEAKKTTGKLVAPKPANNLLRRAVSNTARHSMPARDTYSTVIDLTLDNSDDDSPSRKPGSLERQSREGQPQLRRLLSQAPPGDEHGRLHRKYASQLYTPALQIRRAPAASPLPHGHPQPKTPPVEAYASLLSQYLARRDSPNPNDNESLPSLEPLTPSRAQQPLSTPTVHETANSGRYATPAPHNLHSHPYFVRPPASKHVPLFSEHGLSTQKAVIDPRLLEVPSKIPPPALNRLSTAPEPLRSLHARPGDVPNRHANEDVVVGEAVTGDDDAAFTNWSAIDADMFVNDEIYQIEDASRPESTLAAETNQEMPAGDDDEFVVSLAEDPRPPLAEQQPCGLDGTHDAMDAVDDLDVTETPAIGSEALDNEDEGLFFGSEDEIDTQLTNFVPHKEIDPLATGKNAETDDRTEVSSPCSDRDMMHDSGYFEGPADPTQTLEDVKDASDDNEDLFDLDLPEGTPPAHSWQELLMMAFKAKGPKSINVKDIYAFIEDRFPYYKNNTSAWKDGIQSCLDNQPEFVQVSRFRPLWVFKSSLQHTASETASQPSASDAKDELERLTTLKSLRHTGSETGDQSSSSDAKEEPERLITLKSLRERAPRVDQTGPIKKGLGRPRKASRDKTAVVVSDTPPSQPVQEAGPVITISDDQDELAPSPDKITAQKPTCNHLKASSVLAAPSNAFERLHASVPQTLSSDINRDPESSPGAPVTQSNFWNAANAFQDAMSELSKVSNTMLSSSSPLVSMKTPGTVYSKADTPGTSHSTLFGRGRRPQHRGVAALRSSVAPGSARSRSSSVALPGSRKRVVYTPVRDVEGSEDELG